jgi:Domain of unknown function (DUF4423)
MATSPPRNYAAISAELIHALRGRRSQAGLSKRLGYRSNIVQRWESAQCWPSAARFFSACRRLGVELDAALARFHSPRPRWLDEVQLTSAAGVARWLRELKGKTPIGVLAEAGGVSRFRVSRWLKGEAQPRLPELLLMVDLCSRRLVDFVAALTPPAGLPSLAGEYDQLGRAREAAYRHPWSHAVLRALELPQPSIDQAQWLSQTLGIEVHEVARALDVLAESGQVTKRAGHYVPHRVVHVNTSAQPAQARALKRVWADVASARLAGGQPGLFGYTLFAASREDVRRIRELQLQFARQMQSLIAQSNSSECVGLFCIQLLDLSVREDNALAVTEAPTRSVARAPRRGPATT